MKPKDESASRRGSSRVHFHLGGLGVAVLMSVPAVAWGQTGQITSLTVQPSQVTEGGSVAVTVQGEGSCGRVNVVFGDGDSTAAWGPGFPREVTHTYNSPGNKTVVARSPGQWCSGSATAVLAVSNSNQLGARAPQTRNRAGGPEAQVSPRTPTSDRDAPTRRAPVTRAPANVPDAGAARAVRNPPRDAGGEVSDPGAARVRNAPADVAQADRGELAMRPPASPPKYQATRIDIPGCWIGCTEEGCGGQPVYSVGDSVWVKALLENVGGTAAGPIHVAPLLIRTDVAGAAPSLAALPLEASPPAPGQSSLVTLTYRVPYQIGKYETRIFVAESHPNDQGIPTNYPILGYVDWCRPFFEVVKAQPYLKITEADVDAHARRCGEWNETLCTLPVPDWARVTVRNVGNAMSTPFTVNVQVNRTCPKGTVMEGPSIPPGGEVQLQGVFPIPGFASCVASLGVVDAQPYVTFSIPEYPQTEPVNHFEGFTIP